jgi:SAM-dependent methyltransferase
MSTIHDWFRTGLGRTLAEEECRLLTRRLTAIRARQVLQVGAYGRGQRPALFGEARHWLVDSWPDGPVDLAADAASLPFAAGTMDVVILVHQLEFHPHPHQVLREAVQVLAPEGHMIVLGFNPISLWGLRRLLAGRGGSRPPWSGRYLTALRIEDWLTLLGLEVRRRDGLMMRPPVNRPRLLRRLEGLERHSERYGRWLGGVRLTVARRRVAGLVPPALVLKPRLEVIPGGLAQARSSVDTRK